MTHSAHANWQLLREPASDIARDLVNVNTPFCPVPSPVRSRELTERVRFRSQERLSTFLCIHCPEARDARAGAPPTALRHLRSSSIRNDLHDKSMSLRNAKNETKTIGGPEPPAGEAVRMIRACDTPQSALYVTVLRPRRARTPPPPRRCVYCCTLCRLL
ncbi:hypothetical protein EVAR_21184_1 [Eumeta japonica]|uniref:Uncharacterized protein n=1 Tax=Eumeta variegata TaxID=151549 RepID=A0A4C1UQE4_EUMVA|nr:hypothetical protein EVAR_21184_1 [Eumeta japonica]